MNPSNPCLQAALEYLKVGWSPLALCPPSHAGCSQTHVRTCTKPGKRPLGEWKEFQKRRATEEVRQWWTDTPLANVGIATGEVSGVIGIDVDGIAGEERLHEIACDDVPKTVTFNTGKEDSYRYFYALPPGHPCPTFSFVNADGSEPLKFLGNGAQTVMPPSRHILGTKYCWVTLRSPSECPVTPAPRWLLKRLKDKAEEKAGKATPVATVPPIADGEIVNAGGRNVYLTRIAGARDVPIAVYQERSIWRDLSELNPDYAFAEFRKKDGLTWL